MLYYKRNLSYFNDIKSILLLYKNKILLFSPVKRNRLHSPMHYKSCALDKEKEEAFIAPSPHF